MEKVVELQQVSKTFRLPLEKKNYLMQYLIALLHGKIGYRKLEALREISLGISKGDAIALIGSNGSGKTTLLKLIAGILVPSSGNVIVREKPVALFGLGVGFQEELTARENVFLYGALMGMTRREVEEKFSHIIEFAELEDFVDVKLKQFSGGMQLRLAFSTAIHSNSELFLIDEVFAVGDEHFQKKCLNVFQKFKGGGKTIVLVSHNMNRIKKFCNRVVWLGEGKIRGDGKPAEIIKEYIKES